MKKAVALLIVIVFSCSKTDGFKPEWTAEKAPDVFEAHFQTTKGDFEIEVKRVYAPRAADRFFQLISHSYYDHAIFYRVVDGFVAQFGNTDTLEMNRWRAFRIPDEPVLLSNKKGTVSFAREGKDSRDLELFINLSDNTQLDTLNFEGVRGFPAFGKVTKGIEVVQSLYSGYGEETMENYENLYLDRPLFYRTYPKLDLIEKVYLVK